MKAKDIDEIKNALLYCNMQSWQNMNKAKNDKEHAYYGGVYVATKAAIELIIDAQARSIKNKKGKE